jgi:hypothetical protein
MIDTRDTSFDLPLQKLSRAKSGLARAMPHRSLARAPFSVFDLAAGVCIALALSGLLFALQPLVMSCWVKCIEFWLKALGFPVGLPVGDSTGQRVDHLLAPITVAPAAPSLLFAAFGVAGLAWVICGRLRGKHLPIMYLVRCLCAVMLLSILVFLLSPHSFSYSLAQHVNDLLIDGYRCLLVFPFVLCIGYYLFHERLVVKLLYSLVIELYFLVMIPHKVLVHIITLQFGSRLTMPLLYVCLGSAFDICAFVALYAWVLSNLPAQHRSGEGKAHRLSRVWRGMRARGQAGMI